MFSLFRKKKLIGEKDYDLLKSVVNSLPGKYSYLVAQASKEFILDKKVNPLGKKGTYTLTLNAELEAKYVNRNCPQFFIIRDIGVWNIFNNSFEQIELHILEGMLAGFRVNEKYSALDFNKIDTVRIKEKHFKDEEKEFLRKLIGDNVPEKVLSFLEIESTFKIELFEGEFFVIKDLGDGNYLSMDKKGAVFGMIHDPYEIEKLFDNKDVFLEALSLGEFNISEYYEKKCHKII